MFRKKNREDMERERREQIRLQEETATAYFSMADKSSTAWKWLFNTSRSKRNNIYYIVLAVLFALVYFLTGYLRSCSLIPQAAGFIFSLFVLLRFINFEKHQRMRLPYADGFSILFLGGVARHLEDKALRESDERSQERSE